MAHRNSRVKRRPLPRTHTRARSTRRGPSGAAAPPRERRHVAHEILAGCADAADVILVWPHADADQIVAVNNADPLLDDVGALGGFAPRWKTLDGAPSLAAALKRRANAHGVPVAVESGPLPRRLYPWVQPLVGRHAVRLLPVGVGAGLGRRGLIRLGRALRELLAHYGDHAALLVDCGAENPGWRGLTRRASLAQDLPLWRAVCERLPQTDTHTLAACADNAGRLALLAAVPATVSV